jgi:L-asparaginase II
MAIGIMPGTLAADSPGVGIAFKISDGDPGSCLRADPNSRVRPAVSLEILRQLGVLGEKELAALSDFGPVKAVQNWRKVNVGESRPAFILDRTPAA